MRVVVSFITLLFFFAAYTQTDTLEIHINSGQHQLIDSSYIPVKAFNESSILDFNAQLFEFSLNQKIVLRFINHDTINHQIEIAEYGIIASVKANSDEIVLFNPNVKGTFKMCSKSLFPSQEYLGLSAIVVVGANTAKSYYWNIKEFETSLNQTVNSGGAINFSNYNPNFFLINGKSNPDIGLDSLAKIKGNVGDTLILHILNSGNSVHSLHFHGYHFRVLFSSKFPEKKDWVKDTYGVYSKEIVVVEIVPDKPGEYPVHDHNLVATTSNNIYPNGMFTTIVIGE